MASKKRKRKLTKRSFDAALDSILEEAASIIESYFGLSDYHLHIEPRSDKKVTAKFSFILESEIEVSQTLGRWINDHLRTIFTSRFRLKTVIALLIIGKHMFANERSDWRTLSATETPAPAFTQADFNVNAWVVKGTYDACGGLSFSFACIPPKTKKRRGSKKTTKRKR